MWQLEVISQDPVGGEAADPDQPMTVPSVQVTGSLAHRQIHLQTV